IKMLKNQRGFTLIEIAIVLVIIGLLLGGVLKGQELMDNARVKRVINDFNGLSAAIYGYQDRYKKLPGDDNTTEARWSTTVGTQSDGNGNGQITGAWNGGGNIEPRRMWLHLRAAGLVSGTATGQPSGAGGAQATNAYGGLVGVDEANLGLTGIVLCQSSVPGKVAALIDIELDDGISNTGQVVAALGAINNNANPDAGSNIYTEANSGTAMTICKPI
ncbi:MAG: prepilin-type N-terminal cleavage/methylation domain-containing protein, partial [Candidatus Pacearchaeota archaeon]|nr:prepilin-type N-terminal cleavage/methylation domain-containing protein [Candidatus Pacearchaeota archaeon]